MFDIDSAKHNGVWRKMWLDRHLDYCQYLLSTPVFYTLTHFAEL